MVKGDDTVKCCRDFFMSSIFSGETEQNLQTVMTKLSLDLVSDPGDMLQVLSDSKARGTAVGIKAPTLGTGIFVTAVDDVVMGHDITIVLRSYDVTGYMLETNKLKLGEIVSVFPFKSFFQNPYLRNIGQSKSL
jgi:hypothetical protein